MAQISTDELRVKSLIYEGLERNQTLPVFLTSVKVVGGVHTRDSLLRTHIDPLLAKPYTTTTLLKAVDESTQRLRSFGIFNSVAFGLDVAPSAKNANLNYIPLEGTLLLQEASRIKIKTGTDIGNGDVSAYATGSIANLFGGAETLSADAKVDSLKQSSYLLNYNTPIKNSSMWSADFTGLVTTNERDWASHEETTRGIRVKAVGPGVLGGEQEIGYEAFMRTVGNLPRHASTSVRTGSGESFKSSVFNQFSVDKTNSIVFPTEGYKLKLRTEIAGFEPNNKGDVQFMKGEAQSTFVKSFFNENITLSFGARGGLLWSLLSSGKTYLPDRFFIGGPNSVRGFYLNRLGPSDDEDSIGGEAFLSTGVSLFSRFPNIAKESPLRLHLFANAGSLLGIDRLDPSRTFKKLVSEPSVSAGVGVIYAHPVARFELNFTLPIATRASEFPRKGFQWGLGMSFL
ncbi:surface antigen-domain-containing protein [Myxozyma melibiosi]|uniref:Surface antigen-domain-containing protein n=1 Tax=Myxozyma melibiosi TaxID=54550 RepID=A0ABR1F8W6_9ASCO